MYLKPYCSYLPGLLPVIVLLFGSCCYSDGYRNEPPKGTYNLVLADSANKIYEVTYTTPLAGRKVYESAEGTQSVKWDFVYSANPVNIIIRHLHGYDTLVYSIEKDFYFYEGCNEESVNVSIKTPVISHYSFDSIYSQTFYGQDPYGNPYYYGNFTTNQYLIP